MMCKTGFIWFILARYIVLVVDFVLLYMGMSLHSQYSSQAGLAQSLTVYLTLGLFTVYTFPARRELVYGRLSPWGGGQSRQGRSGYWSWKLIDSA
ncbi:MAG: hypothetical protein B6U97_04440 [Candidatus Altiarchaeales archaeon ex4484_96]|nr:MAG: hypothetical protein B6U97_04440 [Candidatus Altiarchaeales archaeon ex4484_96]